MSCVNSVLLISFNATLLLENINRVVMKTYDIVISSKKKIEKITAKISIFVHMYLKYSK